MDLLFIRFQLGNQNADRIERRLIRRKLLDLAIVKDRLVDRLALVTHARPRPA